MKTETFFLQMNDSTELYVKKWCSETVTPIAIVQIAHGMAEHIERYDELAEFLVNKNIFVYGHDHRGHGQTVRDGMVKGYFTNHNGFEIVVDDMKYITDFIQEQHRDVPIFLLGHSMGSFIVRRYIQKHEAQELAGVILSGTAGNPGILGILGRWLAKRESSKKGATTESPLMNTLTFGAYNKKIKQARTEFDWLSTDQKEVDAYIEDPHCGGVFTAGFFHDLLTGIKTIHKSENIKRTPQSLPILLVAGKEDPVGGFSKSVLAVYQSYKQAGIQDVTNKIYPGMRHELFKEIERQQVFDDVYTWIKDKLQV
ncbi:lysophospholipase [Bacillus sp. HMF5848]|uniref:alpha/beta hydrolase n=1 Tax=Bacillus sp. HMF5848 TaxID=2495421 RepID=UPI000F769051|nr:alpha/beta hydrolase [Bacillus sp. HMF5848]RSK26527.1 lysophospholipase [Bacillus sp. HMF5848]